VHVPLGLPVGVGELLERAHRAHPGAVDEHVQAPEALPAGGNRPVPGIGLGDVQSEALGAATDAGASRLERLSSAPDEKHLCPLGAELLRHREPDPPRATGDDAGAVSQSEVHGRPILPCRLGGESLDRIGGLIARRNG
jgi:hypothetical protein